VNPTLLTFVAKLFEDVGRWDHGDSRRNKFILFGVVARIRGQRMGPTAWKRIVCHGIPSSAILLWISQPIARAPE
jgi:hypothetical protein